MEFEVSHVTVEELENMEKATEEAKEVQSHGSIVFSNHPIEQLNGVLLHPSDGNSVANGYVHYEGPGNWHLYRVLMAESVSAWCLNSAFTPDTNGCVRV